MAFKSSTKAGIACALFAIVGFGLSCWAMFVEGARSLADSVSTTGGYALMGGYIGWIFVSDDVRHLSYGIVVGSTLCLIQPERMTIGLIGFALTVVAMLIHNANYKPPTYTFGP